MNIFPFLVLCKSARSEPESLFRPETGNAAAPEGGT